MLLTPISKINTQVFQSSHAKLLTFFVWFWGFSVRWGGGGCSWVCLVWFWWLVSSFLCFFFPLEENPFALGPQKAVAQHPQNTATSDNPHGGQKVCAKESSATGLILIRVLDKQRIDV